jgi:hypothetical protein
MFERQVGSTTKPIPFLMVSNIGHISGALNLEPDIWLSKNCGPFYPAEGKVFQIGNGWYGLSGNVDDRGVIGDLIIHAESPTADMTDEKGKITTYDPFTLQGGADSNSDEINILNDIYSVLKNLNNYSVPRQGVIH